MSFKYPVYKPFLQGNEKKYVDECLDSTWISSKGKFVSQFEDAFAKYIGIKYATATCNGTTALHLALVALGISHGDEIIVPSLTYIATVNAVSYTGATPVFADSNITTWQINPEDILKKITTHTKAVLIVHLYGYPCNLDEICKICKDYNLFLIEDCAEAIGTKYKGKNVGTFGDISIYSFFGNKTITTGEGGMVITDDVTLMKRAIHFKGQGLAQYREYWHDVIGYNYRMTNICAAIGMAQLEQIEKILMKKRKIAEWYKNAFKNTKVKFHEEDVGVVHSYWMCSILVENPEDREPLREFLKNLGIETRPLFYPVHSMPMYASKFQKLPNAEYLGWRGINLPSYPELTKDDILFISNSIIKFL
jgi:perosamine synthetase